MCDSQGIYLFYQSKLLPMVLNASYHQLLLLTTNQEEYSVKCIRAIDDLNLYHHVIWTIIVILPPYGSTQQIQFTLLLGSLMTNFMVSPVPVRHPSTIHRLCMKDVIAQKLEWITCSSALKLQETNVLMDFQWWVHWLKHLIGITNFEFLCRKLKFVHVGIVQIFIFFNKSARHFWKTLSTLVS